MVVLLRCALLCVQGCEYGFVCMGGWGIFFLGGGLLFVVVLVFLGGIILLFV